MRSDKNKMDIKAFVKKYPVNTKYNFKRNQKDGEVYSSITILQHQSPKPVVIEDGWLISSTRSIHITSPLIIGDNVTITAWSYIELSNIISIGNNVKFINQNGYGDIILNMTNVDTEFETFKTKIGDNLTLAVHDLGTEEVIGSKGEIFISTEDTSYLKTCNLMAKRITIKGDVSIIDDELMSRCKCDSFNVDNYKYINEPTNINVSTDSILQVDAVSIASGSTIEVGSFLYNGNKNIPTGVIGNNVNIKTNKDIMLYVQSIGKNVKLLSNNNIILHGVTSLPNDIHIVTYTLKCKGVTKFNNRTKTIVARKVYLGNIINLPSYFIPDAIGESNNYSVKYLEIESIRSIPSTFPLHADCDLVIKKLEVFDRYFPTSISGSLELAIEHLPSNFNVNIGGSLKLTTLSIEGKFAPKVEDNITINGKVVSLGDKFMPECNGRLIISNLCEGIGGDILKVNVFAPKCDVIILNTNTLRANIDGMVCNEFHANALKNIEVDFSKCEIKEVLSIMNACISTSCDFKTKHIPYINISRSKIGVGYKFEPNCFVLRCVPEDGVKELPLDVQLERISQANKVNMIKVPDAVLKLVDVTKNNIDDRFISTTSDTLVNNKIIQLVEVFNDMTTVVTYDNKSYCIVDGIISEVINRDDDLRLLKVRNVCDGGEINYIVYNNVYSAHGTSIKTATADLIFKTSKRDIEEYKDVDIDDEFTIIDMYAMYRTITGACNTGVKAFMDKHDIEFDDERMITPNDIIKSNSEAWGNIFTDVYGQKCFTNYFNNKNR